MWQPKENKNFVFARVTEQRQKNLLLGERLAWFVQAHTLKADVSYAQAMQVSERQPHALAHPSDHSVAAFLDLKRQHCPWALFHPQPLSCLVAELLLRFHLPTELTSMTCGAQRITTPSFSRVVDAPTFFFFFFFFSVVVINLLVIVCSWLLLSSLDISPTSSVSNNKSATTPTKKKFWRAECNYQSWGRL